MRFLKDSTLFYNDTTEISKFPEYINDYKIGNRSPIEWVVDQYKDWKSEEHPTYVIELIKKLITVTKKSIDLIKEINEMYKG